MTCIAVTNPMLVSLPFQLIALCFLHSLVVMAIYVIPGRKNSPQLQHLRPALPPPQTEGRCRPSDPSLPSIHSRPISDFLNRPSTLISRIKEACLCLCMQLLSDYSSTKTSLTLHTQARLHADVFFCMSFALHFTQFLKMVSRKKL